jgi:hypothetical protein
MKLHREVWLLPKGGIGGAGLVDLGDAGMLQTSKRPRFLSEAVQSIGCGQAELDHFESHDACGSSCSAS